MAGRPNRHVMRRVRQHIQCSNKGGELAGHLRAVLRYETRWLLGLIPTPLLLSLQRLYSLANPADVLRSWFSPSSIITTYFMVDPLSAPSSPPASKCYSGFLAEHQC